MPKLDTGHGPFVTLINQGQVYVVPEYQRPYSWRAKVQVAELWGDIHRLYLHRVDDKETFSHFIGSFVTGAAAAKALGPAEYPVIDGQQRLITLSLIVAAIRDEIVASEAARDAITKKYLALDDEDGELRSRVRPGEDDRRAFDQIVRAADVTDKGGNIYKTYQFIRSELSKGPGLDVDPDSEDEKDTLVDSASEIDDDEGSDVEATATQETREHSPKQSDYIIKWDWKALIEVVGTQLELVSIADVPAESAYQIFATLNSKGLELAQVDLIRNGVFMLLPNLGKRAHRELWQPLEQALGQKGLQSYLHTWVIRSGNNVPVKEVYSSAMRELSKPGSSEDRIYDILTELYTGAWSYALIVNPTSNERNKFFDGPSVPPAIVGALIRIQDWGARPAEPVLVEIIERYRTGRLSNSEAYQALVYLESFMVRRHISHIPPNDLRSTFARLTQQVSFTTKGSSFVDALTAGLSEQSRRWPTDDELLEDMRRRPLYRKKAVRQARFILKRIAEHLDGKECPNIRFGTASAEYSIEHILPQHLSEAWVQDLNSWGDSDPYHTHESRLHVIGNLTITAYNSELSNSSFWEKQDFIAGNLGLQLSKRILEANDWTRQEIDDRSRALWEAARVIWPRL